MQTGQIFSQILAVGRRNHGIFENITWAALAVDEAPPRSFNDAGCAVDVVLAAFPEFEFHPWPDPPGLLFAPLFRADFDTSPDRRSW